MALVLVLTILALLTFAAGVGFGQPWLFVVAVAFVVMCVFARGFKL